MYLSDVNTVGGVACGGEQDDRAEPRRGDGAEHRLDARALSHLVVVALLRRPRRQRDRRPLRRGDARRDARAQRFRRASHPTPRGALHCQVALTR